MFGFNEISEFIFELKSFKLLYKSEIFLFKFVNNLLLFIFSSLNIFNKFE